jgi:hypothetical protein
MKECNKEGLPEAATGDDPSASLWLTAARRDPADAG